MRWRPDLLGRGERDNDVTMCFDLCREKAWAMVGLSTAVQCMANG
jgi:hypothetical protein